MSNVVDLNREAARRAGATDAREREARKALAQWIDDNSHLGAQFLIASLRSALNAVEVFHDMTKE